MTISPGSVVIAGRYEVGELLGRGGMADVHAGIDRRLDRPVAIKRLRPDMAAREDVRTRFEVEATMAARLSHPNAVAVFDTGEEGGVPYIVMERLPGETLADRMAAGPVDPQWLRSVAEQVLGALAAAHAVGIVHRDVKPGNILLAADGTAKVADFGIAKSLPQPGEPAGGGGPDLTGDGQWVGTLAYVAPERIAGAPAAPSSDIYSLGVVLYEALAGRKPFVGDSPLWTAQAIVESDHRPLAEARPDLDPALVATVEQAMAPAPEARFGSARAMAEALAGSAGVPMDATVDAGVPGDHTAILEEPPITADRTGRGYMAPTDVVLRGRWRRVWFWGVVGAVGLVLMLVLAVTADDSPPAATDTNAAVEANSPMVALATKLQAQAARLSPADGPAAAEAAQGLEDVARRVTTEDAGPAATLLLASVGEWNRNGELSDPATAAIAALLQQVPGVDPAAINPPPTTAAPTPVAPSESQTEVDTDEGKKGKDADDRKGRRKNGNGADGVGGGGED